MDFSNNIVEITDDLQDRFHAATSLPPELWTADPEELNQRCKVEMLRADIGALLHEYNLPIERAVEAVVEELVNHSLTRLPMATIRKLFAHHADAMIDWSERKSA